MSSNPSELINTKNVTANSIISIEININIMFFLFKTNPKVPIRNNIKDNFTYYNIYTYIMCKRKL